MHNFYYEKKGNNVACIQDEIPFEIPESWTWCRLVNLFEIGSSKRVHKSDWRCSGVPFYRARDIEDLSNGFFKSELYIDKKFYDDCKAKYGVPEINDILISAVGTLGKVFVVRDKSPFYYKDGNIICLSNFSNTNPDFIKMLFASSFIEKQIHSGSHGVTVDTYTIIRANQTIIPLPSRSEQDRIVKVWKKCLKELATINNCKDEITKICGIIKTKILDSFFGENSSYKSYYENEYSLGELLQYEQPGPFIVKSTEYNDSYKIPVLTPGKSFILGYTNETDGVYKVNAKKVIIFDDFTTASRLIDFDFKVKSSAMKILTNRNDKKFNIVYLYYLLKTIYVNNDTHKRYWISEYAPIKLKVHTYDEQNKIVSDISKINDILDCIQ